MQTYPLAWFSHFPRLRLWMRARRTLFIAAAVSFTLHALSTIGTSLWLGDVQAPRVVQFNAVLNPSPAWKAPEILVSTKPLPTHPAPKNTRRRARPAASAPKSEAAFVAPENAITVEAPVSAGQGDPGAGDAVVDRKETKTAVGPVDPAAGRELPRDIVTKTAAIERPQPETVPVATLPSRVSISYSATSSIADGVAHYKWKRTDEKYTFASTIQASGFFAEMFAGTLTQLSAGTVTATGIEPDNFSIRRGDRAAETAEFQRAAREVKLSRSGESRQVPMPPNLQDTQSFLFQLAIEAVKLKTPEDRLTIFVTNARGINEYTFKKLGESILETRFGPVETVHLAREINEPTDGYEVWLSPKNHYLPVKLKFFVGRFPAELIATTITSAP